MMTKAPGNGTLSKGITPIISYNWSKSVRESLFMPPFFLAEAFSFVNDSKLRIRGELAVSFSKLCVRTLSRLRVSPVILTLGVELGVPLSLIDER